MRQLTKETHRRIIEELQTPGPRGYPSPELAAMCAGVPPELFKEWMAEGRKIHALPWNKYEKLVGDVYATSFEVQGIYLDDVHARLERGDTKEAVKVAAEAPAAFKDFDTLISGYVRLKAAMPHVTKLDRATRIALENKKRVERIVARVNELKQGDAQ